MTLLLKSTNIRYNIPNVTKIGNNNFLTSSFNVQIFDNLYHNNPLSVSTHYIHIRISRAHGITTLGVDFVTPTCNNPFKMKKNYTVILQDEKNDTDTRSITKETTTFLQKSSGKTIVELGFFNLSKLPSQNRYTLFINLKLNLALLGPFHSYNYLDITNTSITIMEGDSTFQTKQKLTFDPDKHPDFVIISSDYEFLNCHKFMLCAASPVFDAMLNPTSNTSEYQNGKVVLTESCEILRFMIDYIYDKILPSDVLNIENILDYVMLADKYNISQLVPFLMHKFRTMIEPRTIMNLCHLLKRDNFDILKPSILDYLVKNHKELMTCDIIWKNLSSEYPEIILQMYERITSKVKRKKNYFDNVG